MAGFTDKSPYKQPIGDPDTYQVLSGQQETIEFLPGTSMRIWYTHRADSYPEHWHSAMEIIVGVNEHYECIAEGVSYQINPGDIMIIPGGILHSLTPAHDCNGFVYFLSLDFLDDIRSASCVMTALRHPIHITQSSSPTLHMAAGSLLEQMRNAYFSENEMRELLVDSYLLMLIERLINHNLHSPEENSHSRIDKQQEYRELFSKVAAYIDKHYAEQLSVEQMAAQFGLSKYYFSRLFAKYLHCQFNEFLTLRRLKAAENMLMQPDMSITDIAFGSGFGSNSSFSRAFHEHRGCSPSEYRKAFVITSGERIKNEE